MWEAFTNWIFGVIQMFNDFCGDWGLAIIVVTVIFRLIVTPIMHAQARSSYQMQKIQPRINELQEKYADDKVRQSQEMQKIYADAKYNPLMGCIPMLLQMPIFIALFQVLRGLGDREGISDLAFYNIVPDLICTPSQAFSQGIGAFLPYLILMVIFAGATFLPMILQQLKSTDTKQKNQMMIMAVVMSIFMLWISWTSPAGVLLFWGTSSLIGVAQNQISMHFFRKQDEKREAEEVIEVKPVEVNVTRKERKPRPKKKR